MPTNHRWAANASQCARLAALTSSEQSAWLNTVITISCSHRAWQRLKQTATVFSSWSLKKKEGRTGKACWDRCVLALGLRDRCFRWACANIWHLQFIQVNSSAPQAEAQNCPSEPAGIWMNEYSIQDHLALGANKRRAIEQCSHVGSDVNPYRTYDNTKRKAWF